MSYANVVFPVGYMFVGTLEKKSNIILFETIFSGYRSLAG
jgi:hypothetical protein